MYRNPIGIEVFVKISTKGRYGLRFCIELAMRPEQQASLREVSSHMGVSEKYLWQVIAPMKAAGLILSSAGAQGGFRLAEAPEKLTAYEVLRSVEGELPLVGCSVCPREGGCAAQHFWARLTDTLTDAMRACSIQELAEEQQNLNRKNRTQPSLDYCI